MRGETASRGPPHCGAVPDGVQHASSQSVLRMTLCSFLHSVRAQRRAKEICISKSLANCRALHKTEGKAWRGEAGQRPGSQGFAKHEGTEGVLPGPQPTVHPPGPLYVLRGNTFCFLWMGHTRGSPGSLLTSRFGPSGTAAGTTVGIESLAAETGAAASRSSHAGEDVQVPTACLHPRGDRALYNELILHLQKCHGENGNGKSSLPLFE